MNAKVRATQSALLTRRHVTKCRPTPTVIIKDSIPGPMELNLAKISIEGRVATAFELLRTNFGCKIDAR